MPTAQSYQQAAEAYAAGVQAFVKASAEAGREPAAGREHAVEPAALPAEELAPVSSRLTEAAAERLNASDPAERAAASAQLLAKALVDLEISRRLLAAAQAEEQSAGAEGALTFTEQGAGPVASNADIEAGLRVLLGEAPASPPDRARALASPPADVPAARQRLSATVQITLLSVRDQAAQTGQQAIGGMLTLGIGEIARAAGLVGLDIARALGEAEKVTRLYNLARTYALNAYNALVAAFGPGLAQLAAQQALQWVHQVASGQQFAGLLDKLYQTAQTQRQVDTLVAGSQAPLDRYVTAIQAVDRLDGAYSQQIGLTNKILTGLTVFGGVSSALVPNVRLLLAALYIMVAAYVVATGADYADASQIKVLNRVPGVREVVEQNLA